MSRLAALNAGLWLGLVAGAGDGIGVVLENPRSFEGTSIVAFVGAALAIGTTIGGVAGLLAVALRVPPGAVMVSGIALALFGAAGVRMHVRWFFGEPLLAPGSLIANVGLAAVSVAAAGIVWKIVGRGVSGIAAGRGLAVIGVVLGGLGALGALVAAPRSTAPAADAAPPAGARDVLLVTLDTTRADHLSCYGYPRGTTPAIDRLARTGVTTARVYAPIPLTNPSHASMLTGLAPREHTVLNNGMALPAEIPTFVPEMAGAGWHCAAFVSGIPLKGGVSGLAPGFHTYDDVFSPLESVHPMLTSLAVVRIANRIFPVDLIERRAEDTCVAAIRWLRTTESPRFLWVHLFDPHTPYDAPGVLRRRFAVESSAWTAAGRSVTEWPIADYDAELRETDRWLENLLREFREVTGDVGSVILTGDHGEGLEQHGELTHGAQLYDEDLLVPYVVTHPDADRGRLEDTRAFSSRSVARLVPLLAWPRPLGPTTEFSILCETFAPEGREDRSAFVEVRAGYGRKVVMNRETGHVIGFDLETDPEEKHPRSPTGDWAELVGRLPEGRAAREPNLDPETVRRLRALGYVH